MDIDNNDSTDKIKGIITITQDIVAEQNKQINDFKKDALYVGNVFLQTQIDDIVLSCKRTVEYNPKKMWFDYNALFNKTKNKIIGKNDSIKVKCVDFNKNTVARNVVFGLNQKCDNKLLEGVLHGDNKYQYLILNNMLDYINFELRRPGNDIEENVIDNYKYLLSIVVTFGEYSSLLQKEYFNFASDEFKIIPIYIKFRSGVHRIYDGLDCANFYAVSRPILYKHIPKNVLDQYY